MKVSNTGKHKADGSLSSTGGTRGSQGAGRLAPVQETFAEVVEDLEARQLLDELDIIGAQLSRFPTSTLLGRYRELVRMALERVRGNTQMRREFKWRRTERAMYIIVERVEGALDEMDDALLREGERTRLLSLMNEVKGCLISLLF